MTQRSGSLRSRWRRSPVQESLPLPEPEDGGADAAVDGFVELRWWQRRMFVLALAVITVALFGVASAALVRSNDDRRTAVELRKQVQQLTVRPTSTERRIRITPNPRSWSAEADVTLRYPDPPELLELYMPVGYAAYGVFGVTIEKVDHGRLVVLQRVVPDSNRDLRVALNSSAFGPGEYRIRLQGYTWRGARQDAGWVRLVID